MEEKKSVIIGGYAFPADETPYFAEVKPADQPKRKTKKAESEAAE